MTLRRSYTCCLGFNPTKHAEPHGSALYCCRSALNSPISLSNSLRA